MSGTSAVLFNMPWKGGGKSTVATVTETVLTIPNGATGVTLSADLPIYLTLADTVAVTPTLTVNDTNYGRFKGDQITFRFQAGGDFVHNTIRWAPETAVATTVRYAWLH